MFTRIIRNATKAATVIAAAMLTAHSANAGWFSMAMHENGSWGTSINQPTKKAAIKAALETCKKYAEAKTNCTTFSTRNSDGYYVVAQSPSRLQLSFGDTQDGATNLALNDCAAHTPKDETCEVKWTGVLTSAKQVPQNKNSDISGDCRPRTNVLRCTSNCVNGNCTVTYENGCKMRVRVNPKFDPFSNQWTYPSPAC